jgi:hypothetical protein
LQQELQGVAVSKIAQMKRKIIWNIARVSFMCLLHARLDIITLATIGSKFSAKFLSSILLPYDS